MALQNHPQIQAAQHEAAMPDNKSSIDPLGLLSAESPAILPERRATTIRASEREVCRLRAFSIASDRASW